MFFVFGSPRSGTTLLAQSLHSHPEIVIPHETDFIVPSAFIFDRIADLVVRRELLTSLVVKSRGFSASIGEFLTPDQIGEIIELHCGNAAIFLERIYAAIAVKAGVRMAGDKSPNDLLFLRMLMKVGMISPATKIIHIVRDIRDVLASLIRHIMTDEPARWFPQLWSSSNLYLHTIAGGSENYMLVRYEELVVEPEKWFRSMCEHIGVQYEPVMLDPKNRHPRYLGQAAHGHLYSPIAPLAYEGRADLERDVVAACERQAAPAMATFGYS